jgi:glycerol-3-phosphate cytidylyltransferase
MQRAKAQGDYLIVGLSTDDFNAIKGKESYHDYETRKKMIEALRDVDEVIPEKDWNQKVKDVKKHNIDLLVMGDDWKDDERFTSLQSHVDVEFLERTPEISTTKIKTDLKKAASKTAKRRRKAAVRSKSYA